jgi:hypothetical protein
MTDHTIRRRVRRGLSLVELMVAMTGVSMVLATTAALLHGVMRAQSESRRFFDDERSSVRLARQWRADLHAAESITAAEPLPASGSAEGEPTALATLLLPAGRRIEYSLAGSGDRIVRLTKPLDGSGQIGREDFPFAGPVAVTLGPSPDPGSRRWIFAVGPPPRGDAGDGAAPSAPAPRSSGEARRKPPAVLVEAEIGRDLRFTRGGAGEANR